MHSSTASFNSLSLHSTVGPQVAWRDVPRPDKVSGGRRGLGASHWSHVFPSAVPQNERNAMTSRKICLKRLKILCASIRNGSHVFSTGTIWMFTFLCSQIENLGVCLSNIVTYKGLAWLIIMGSGFDEWIYWHFFTTTINYDSSQSMTLYESLHSLLNYERLLFHCDEYLLSHWTPLRMTYEVKVKLTLRLLSFSLCV
jgi:hypothetical protein